MAAYLARFIEKSGPNGVNDPPAANIEKFPNRARFEKFGGLRATRVTSVPHGLIEKGIQGPDSSVRKDRNVHTRDNRRGSGRSELPPQTAKIVIDLRRPHRAKHEIREHP